MPRSTINDVEDNYKPLPGQNVLSFIEKANRLVTGVLGGKLSEDRLHDIETFVACGFCILVNPRTSSSSTKSKSSTNEGNTENRYFAAAIALDSTGRLAQALSPKGLAQAKVTVLKVA